MSISAYWWVALFAVATSASAQAPAESSTRSTHSFLGRLLGQQDDFAVLKRQRRQLIRDVDSLERDIKNDEAEVEQLSRGLADSTREVAFLKDRLQSISARLTKLTTSAEASPAVRKPIATGAAQFDPAVDIDARRDLELQKASAESRVKEVEDRQARVKKLRDDLRPKRDELSARQNSLFELEEKISNALNTGTTQFIYRSVVSLFFAVIVFFLVYRFFKIVQSDDLVKRSIFSGEAGIQFITLFSIVIAVILFGILDILGANELSALLGGLSGYILGKTGPMKAGIANLEAPIEVTGAGRGS